MRKGAFLAVLLLAGQCLAAQSFAECKKMFWDQMASTCATGLRWEKSVTEIAEDGTATTETKAFDVDCYAGLAKDATTTIALTPAEFGHLFEYAFDNPYIADDLEVIRTAYSVEAKPKAGREQDCKLQLQRFAWQPDNGLLLYAEAHISKGSPLYDLDVHITVRFDAVGHYAFHEVETTTDVLLGGTVHTLIKARLL
jgi:hypothetical protein